MEKVLDNIKCSSCIFTCEFRGLSKNDVPPLYFKERRFSVNVLGDEYEINTSVKWTIKKITITAKNRTAFSHIYSAALNLMRLDSFLEGKFFSWKSCKIDGNEYIEEIRDKILPYLESNISYSMLSIDIDDEQYSRLYSNWAICYNRNINLNQLFLYAAFTRGMTSDVRMALMLQIFEPLESNLFHEGKINREITEQSETYTCPCCGHVFNQLTLEERLRTLIINYGQNIFKGDNTEMVIKRSKETRNMIGHAKSEKDVKGRIFSSCECGFYLQKFSMLFRYIILLELGINQELLDAAVYKAIDSLNKEFPQCKIV